jgi:hypothetical protein
MPLRLALGIVFLFLVATVADAQRRNTLDLATAPVAEGAMRIPYGTDALQSGELRLPSAPGPHPLAVVAHAGCWSSVLDKMDPQAVAIDNMRPLAAALTGASIATWNIEYRRVGNEGGGWPGTYRDVALATDMVRSLAENHSI